MPYVRQEIRDSLDKPIDALLEALLAQPAIGEGFIFAAGPLNYAITRLAAGLLRRVPGGTSLPPLPGVSYSRLALVTGVVRNVADELYRRLGAPYEDAMIARHGDLEDLR